MTVTRPSAICADSAGTAAAGPGTEATLAICCSAACGPYAHDRSAPAANLLRWLPVDFVADSIVALSLADAECARTALYNLVGSGPTLDAAARALDSVASGATAMREMSP
jgi:hypothetical protein